VKRLKEKIHPQYFKASARCACGNEFEIGSTKENLKVEICAKCHPFYTGNRGKLIDTTGRVDRFKKKYGLQ
jgi:large subunit ribosomal protein L31